MVDIGDRGSQRKDGSRDAPVETLPTDQLFGSGRARQGDGSKTGNESEEEGKGESTQSQADSPKDDQPKDDQQSRGSEQNKSELQETPQRPWLKWAIAGGILVVLLIASPFLVPWLIRALNTVSTDDAYVNGHVTLVAPRVGGQVVRVLVDDNMRVKKGDLLVELDKEPYRVQLQIKQAAVVAARADLAAAKAQVQGLIGLARSQRWKLQSAMDQVANQVASLRANVATYESRKASLTLAQANYERGKTLLPSGGMSKEDYDRRQQTVKVDEAAVKQALEMVYATRASLGLAPKPASEKELPDVPPKLQENFSGVRSALATLVETMAQIGLPLAKADATPQQVLDEFQKRDASGSSDRDVDSLVANAPAVKQAEGKLLQAERDVDQAQLNLKYCDIVSDIDGVITRRNVNPGNYVDMAQSLMAVRSLREIWIDANFKEGQLGHLRIGQRVRCEVDMYGSHHEFEGRITGFTMGTGQTLSLLPPQNATGNFVKIVQRLPVRIELTDYDPNQLPLFVGLSVVPYVYYKEPAEGPNAGELLQPYARLPQRAPDPRLATQ